MLTAVRRGGAILVATRDATEAMLCVLVMLSTDTALGKCDNAGINEGLGKCWQFTIEWEQKLMSRVAATNRLIPVRWPDVRQFLFGA